MNLTKENIKEIITEFPKKHKKGFTSKELKSIFKKYNVDGKKFSEILGVHTCESIKGEFITYTQDVMTVLNCILEDREMNIDEWD